MVHQVDEVFLVLANPQGRIAPLRTRALYLKPATPGNVWFLSFYLIPESEYERVCQALRRPFEPMPPIVWPPDPWPPDPNNPGPEPIDRGPVLIRERRGFMPGALHGDAGEVVVEKKESADIIKNGGDFYDVSFCWDKFILNRDRFIRACRTHGDGTCFLDDDEKEPHPM